MIFEWESERDRILRLMRISPRRKLEWLRRMNELFERFSSKERKAIRRKVREAR